jgi:hypothetical protein
MSAGQDHFIARLQEPGDTHSTTTFYSRSQPWTRSNRLASSWFVFVPRDACTLNVAPPSTHGRRASTVSSLDSNCSGDTHSLTWRFEANRSQPWVFKSLYLLFFFWLCSGTEHSFSILPNRLTPTFLKTVCGLFQHASALLWFWNSTNALFTLICYVFETCIQIPRQTFSWIHAFACSFVTFIT